MIFSPYEGQIGLVSYMVSREFWEGLTVKGLHGTLPFNKKNKALGLRSVTIMVVMAASRVDGGLRRLLKKLIIIDYISI